MDFTVPKEYENLTAVKYAQKIARGEIIAGKYIILECIRFLKDLNPSDRSIVELSTEN